MGWLVVTGNVGTARRDSVWLADLHGDGLREGGGGHAVAAPVVDHLAHPCVQVVPGGVGHRVELTVKGHGIGVKGADQFPDDIELRLEMQIEGGAAGAGLGRDVLDPRADIAVALEDRHRGVDEPLPGEFSLLLTQGRPRAAHDPLRHHSSD